MDDVVDLSCKDTAGVTLQFQHFVLAFSHASCNNAHIIQVSEKYIYFASKIVS